MLDAVLRTYQCKIYSAINFAQSLTSACKWSIGIPIARSLLRSSLFTTLFHPIYFYSPLPALLIWHWHNSRDSPNNQNFGTTRANGSEPQGSPCQLPQSHHGSASVTCLLRTLGTFEVNGGLLALAPAGPSRTGLQEVYGTVPMYVQ